MDAGSQSGRGRKRRRSLLPTLLLLLLVCGVLFVGWRWLHPARRQQQEEEDSGAVSVSQSQEEPGEVSSVQGSASSQEDLDSLLAQLAREDPTAAPLAQHPEDYPEPLLELAVRNPETISYVLGWPEHQKDEPADSVEEAEQGTFPQLMQWDPRWGYAEYGDGPLGLTGCGPTCLSMVVCGLTGRTDVTPYTVAAQAEKSGMYVEGTGTSWDLMRLGCERYGLKAEELPLDQGVMERRLQTGAPIICSMGPGDFTTSGHFIVLTGVEDGGFRLLDPNRRANSEKLWDYDSLAGQIRNLWTFSLA